MIDLRDKKVLVIGLGASGQAACELLRAEGARVSAFDEADHERARRAAAQLRALGIEVTLGAETAPRSDFDLAVLSPGVPRERKAVRCLVDQGVRLIGELELGYQQSRCLCIGITGTNGKTTTTELVEKMLLACRRKTVAAGNIGLPLCAIARQTAELDFVTLEVSSFQLETTCYFRPSVAVLLNITPDHLDRYSDLEAYLRAKARIFANQQAFDWAIVQSEALEQLRRFECAIPGKVISFSAQNREADLFLDRGWIVSRLPDWTGPLLDMDKCGLRGPHNAENLMAALAVSGVLRLPLREVVNSLGAYRPAAHRCEPVAEIDGVKYVNDSKATNLDALQKALLAMPASHAGGPNIWLIAGGKDKGLSFEGIEPALAERVKGAFLIGETADKIKAAWDRHILCALVSDLRIAVQIAANKAVAGDIVLLSPACSSFDQFADYKHRGETFKKVVAELKNTTDSGCHLNGTQHNDADTKKQRSGQANNLMSLV